ncbi:DUF3298 and DUF4163 domain-containing protein [Hyphomonas johnsonii]|uniref:Putative lipoprotein n=1 Tax=Hyphomonas johnsonii MHS-2 TaxID=1280950 RepID=A0A059FJ86_9PROT|nr:DUF3298 and DUF4163 domain-containing protein [Hyphomonas johnsonii]KCZ90677.1 putative lipoprotein [Hyphomonas johnsonii MHS-2]
MLKLACCAAIGALTLGACSGKTEPAAPAAPDAPATNVAATGGAETVVAPPEVPVVQPGPAHEISVKTDSFTGSSVIDDRLFEIAPKIAADLAYDSRVRIDAMDNDATTYKLEDPAYFTPFSLTIKWSLVAEAGDLISIEGFTGAYSGGAHGNYYTDARIHDVTTGRELTLRDLLTDPVATVSANLPLIYADIADKRVAAAGDAKSREVFRAESADAISDNSILDGEVGLAASTEAGKFGGYTVHFAPYEIGSFAEGAYRITVPQAAFHDGLKPEYRDLFAGEPVDPEN